MIETSEFQPSWYLRNAHLQTILANIFKPAFPEVEYETVELTDGDRLQLAHGSARGDSTVLLLHGLEGSLESAYPRRIINYLNARDIPITMMFFRGCNGTPNRLARSYHSGETGDLAQVVDHLKQRGIKRIALLGYSLGGNVVLKYLGEGNADPTVICATAVSVPMLLDVCARRMDRGFSRRYQRMLLERLHAKVAQKRDLLEREGYDTNIKARNFYEFDDAFTAKLHGFENADDYYQRCSSRQYLRGIRVPTLILHAEDDPFMTAEVIPKDTELAPAVRLELSRFGGHVGFVQKGLLNPQSWLEPRIHRWLEQELLAQT
jgi:predicted alpha/beta-fold hydrolase